MKNSSDVVVFPNKPEDRLRVALRELENALAEQSLAFQEFRLNIAVLGTAVGGLERGLEGYRGTLDAVALDLAAAHHAARQVEVRMGTLLR